MAGELVSFGIQKLWDTLSQEYAQFKGLDDQVAELRSDLNLLNSFMKDADAKIHTSAMVRNCLEEVKGVICDAEDIIDKILYKEKFGETGGIKKRIKRLTCVIPDRREIALDIGGISKRISKVVSVMQSFQIKQIIDDGDYMQPLQERKRQIRKEFARDIERNTVGLQENVDKLLGYLVEEDDVQVVSITGMGGLGKTTLARQAFNHKKVKNKFDRLLWVCVSQVFKRQDVWQTIYENLTSKEENIRKMEEDKLQPELIRLLEESNSLIVLDDIWKEEDWDLIKPIFPFKPGSKVLLTSRNENVVGRGVTCKNFKPKCLSESDSWTLFHRIAMPIKDASELTDDDKEMEKMGKKMTEKCGGLPLAIRVLGGLLAAKYRVDYWRRVSENIGSRLLGINYFSDDNNNSIYHVLSLSFEELPGYLKYCFLYLAHFPEDYKIKVEDLSNFWAAEGILRYDNGDSIRDVGDSCIEELVRRNMVISEGDRTSGRFETCRLHDLMREICLSKAKEENFLHVVGTSSPTSHSQSLNSSRRFVSHNPRALDVERDINNSKARSLVVVSDSVSWRFSNLGFTRLQLLRVLHLPSADLKGYKLPDSIGKLIHLRYLNLNYVFLSHLPSSLRNLKLLIYLNLKGTGWVHLPTDTLLRMKELRFLALPKSMPKKTKLKLNHLVSLETLIDFSTVCCDIEDLRGMARLRTLGITINDETSLETFSASIDGLRHLESLDIDYKGAKGTKEWSNLLELNNLKKLKLETHIPLISDELQFPSRLTSLELWESGLKEDPMPILEKLVHLKEVYLGKGSFCGRRMVCSRGGFPQLQKLELWGLEEWEEWIVEEGSMPLLHTLHISSCKKLKELSDGLRFITSLEDLSVRNMGEEWKKRLSEGGEDYYKVQHVLKLSAR